MVKTILDTMDRAGFTNPDLKSQAGAVISEHAKTNTHAVPRAVIDADVQEAIDTGRLPRDPHRRDAVLFLVQMGKILSGNGVIDPKRS